MPFQSCRIKGSCIIVITEGIVQRYGMDNWERLELLLKENQFELVNFEQVTPQKDGTDCRLIYLMNDTVESFLVFRNIRYTGEYIKEYEGVLDYAMNPKENYLKVQQGNSCLLMFFDALELETHLYDYGGIGHFWVKGYENLRVLEYQIAIICDKLEYLGEEFCNNLEKEIAFLRYFPPLNYVSYPSASAKYVVPVEHPWQVTETALDFMENICEKVEDQKMKKMIEMYRKHPSIHRAKKIAKSLSYNNHQKITDCIHELILQAASGYPRRLFGKETEERMKRGIRKAKMIQETYRQKGIQARIYREEPFEYDCDGMEMNIYVMILKEGMIRRNIKIIKIYEEVVS